VVTHVDGEHKDDQVDDGGGDGVHVSSARPFRSG
jgi:hypothetical protein